MYSKFKRKTKIFHAYSVVYENVIYIGHSNISFFFNVDFYNPEDLKDHARPKTINLTIEDFNEKGEVANPRAPCVVTTLDPVYIKDAALQRSTRKFRMKTDILTLREITRKKFMFYATQERYLEKQREAAYQEKIYEHITELQEFAADALRNSESRAFTQMKQTQQNLENLEENRISDELKKEIAGHQRVLMEVQEIYGRFLFLLKLIGYFDEIIAPEDIRDVTETGEECKLPLLTEIIDLEINERNSIGEKEVSSILSYMKKIVRPYLDKRNHLNADIWIKGYERTRQKIFNYNRRFQHLALLNHLVDVIHGRSEKTFSRCINQQKFLKDPRFLERRSNFLQQRCMDVLDNFARAQREDSIQIKLNAILPVILKNIEIKFLQINGNIVNQMPAAKIKNLKSSIVSNKPRPANSNTFNKTSHDSATENVEKLQWHLMGLLQDLEKFPPEQRKKIEKQVRKRIEAQKEISRRVLVKQNRLQNWMEHFKKHAILKKN